MTIMLPLSMALMATICILMIVLQIFEKRGVVFIQEHRRLHVIMRQLKSADGKNTKGKYYPIIFKYLNPDKRLKLLNIDSNIFQRAMFIIGIGVSTLVSVIFKQIIFIPIIFIMTCTLILSWVNRKYLNKINDFENYFEDGIQNIVASLHAGMNLVQAFEDLSENKIKIVSDVFKKILEEYSVGLSLQAAVKNVMDEIESDNLNMFVQIIDIYYGSGGDITDILENLLLMLQKKKSHQGDLLAKTSEVRMTANLLILLPLGLLFYLGIFQKSMIDPLLHDPTGQFVLLIGILLWGIGVVIVRKLTNINNIA